MLNNVFKLQIALIILIYIQSDTFWRFYLGRPGRESSKLSRKCEKALDCSAPPG